MRRVCVVVCIVCMLVCCSCTTSTVPPVKPDFSCRFTAEYDDISAAGTIERTAEKTLTITFDSPDTLSGITLIWDGEQVRMRVFGIETALPQSYLPQRAFGTVLNNALDDAVRPGTKANGDLFTLSGTVDGYDYALQCDAESGVPLQLEVPDLPLSVSFSEFDSK